LAKRDDSTGPATRS